MNYDDDDIIDEDISAEDISASNDLSPSRESIFRHHHRIHHRHDFVDEKDKIDEENVDDNIMTSSSLQQQRRLIDDDDLTSTNDEKRVKREKYWKRFNWKRMTFEKLLKKVDFRVFKDWRRRICKKNLFTNCLVTKYNCKYI